MQFIEVFVVGLGQLLQQVGGARRREALHPRRHHALRARRVALQLHAVVCWSIHNIYILCHINLILFIQYTIDYKENAAFVTAMI